MSDELSDLLNLTADIVAAHVSNNRIHTSELPDLIKNVHGALSGLGETQAEPGVPFPMKEAGAVSVRKSLADPNFIVSMIDGKPYLTLKRHLARHGLTPEQYREKYGLKADFPMTAPAYSERRRELAFSIGLGRKAGAKVAAKAPAQRKRLTIK